MFTRRPRDQRCSRRGAVAVMVACCLILLVAVVAIALDGGILQEDRRRAQAAADAAALAAANDLFRTYPTQEGEDGTGSARASALAVAAANGFDDNASDCQVTVNIPPQSGLFKGVDGYAEVVIQYNQTRFFSRLFGNQSLPVSARAVARGAWTPVGNGIICLDQSDKGSLNAHGNGLVKVIGAPIVVNSSHNESAIGNGSNAMLEAPQFLFTGGYTTTGGAQFVGPITTGTRPIPDPLRYLPLPNPQLLPLGVIVESTSQGASNSSTATGPASLRQLPGGAAGFFYNQGNGGGNGNDNGNGNGNGSSGSDSSSGGGGKTYYLTAGRFPGGLTFSGQDSVIMAPGLYYMEGGGFSFSGQGSLIGEGVVIYNAPTKSSDQISITGQGVVRLTPPTSGTYTGLVVFQDRTADVTVKITGNGQLDIYGGFYAANATCMVEGNGDKSIGSQYICRTLDIGGNGNFAVTWDMQNVPRSRSIQLVE